jgi:hypothetical protein
MAAATSMAGPLYITCARCLPSCPGPALQFPKDLEEQVCRTVHHSLQRAEELVSVIYAGLRPPVPARDAATAAAASAAEQVAGEQQPSPFGSKENEPQRHEGSAGAAAAAAVKPAGEEEAAAGEADAAAGTDAAAAAGLEPATAKKAEGGAGAAEGAGAGAAAEQKSGKKAKTPKAPVSKQLLRTYILEVCQAGGQAGGQLAFWGAARVCIPDELPGCSARERSQGVQPGISFQAAQHCSMLRSSVQAEGSWACLSEEGAAHTYFVPDSCHPRCCRMRNNTARSTPPSRPGW